MPFIDQADVWFQNEPESIQQYIAGHFGCGQREFDGRLYFKSHDEGFPYFAISECSICKTPSLLYVSFYEMQPGRYIATLQGAAIASA